VRPYKKIGEDTVSDHGSDNEIILEKKKRGGGRRKKQSAGDGAAVQSRKKKQSGPVADTAAYADATCKFLSCPNSTFDLCGECRKDYCEDHLGRHQCNTEGEDSRPTCSHPAVSSKASKGTRKRVSRISEYFDSDDSEDASSVDSSENEEDEDCVYKSSSNSDEQQMAQTRSSSRPTRAAATTASKSIASRKEGTDYHRVPESLYTQQVLR
jgi:hypothetical protein